MSSPHVRSFARLATTQHVINLTSLQQLPTDESERGWFTEGLLVSNVDGKQEVRLSAPLTTQESRDLAAAARWNDAAALQRVFDTQER